DMRGDFRQFVELGRGGAVGYPQFINDWPFYSGQLDRGDNKVQFANASDVRLKVMLRSEGRGTDLEIPARDMGWIYLADGVYEVYYRGSSGGAVAQGSLLSVSNEADGTQIVYERTIYIRDGQLPTGAQGQEQQLSVKTQNLANAAMFSLVE